MISKKVDAVLVRMTSLDAGLAFYRDALGHALPWRTPESGGLALGDSDTELVLATRDAQQTDLLVDSVEEASPAFIAAGGSIVNRPSDTREGQVVIVSDPFGTSLFCSTFLKAAILRTLPETLLG
jgi:catechol 2,3-dioxygenase-like lactoylglutathione lyase family enzyme